MKLALLAVLAWAGGAHARTLTAPYLITVGLKAEIQIFKNTQPDPKNPADWIYDQKWVSSPRQIVPADTLYPNPYANDRICFFGEPDDAIALFKVMAENMGFPVKTTAIGFKFQDPSRGGKSWLQFDGYNERGETFRWFDVVRQCDAPATETDYRNTPGAYILPPFAD